MSGGESGIKYCPSCRARLKTLVESGSQKNVVVHGLEAKRRNVICSRCKGEWLTVEVIESQLDDIMRTKT